MSAPTFSLPARERVESAGAARRRAESRRAVAPLALAATIGLTGSTLATAYGLCRVFPGWSFLPRMAIVALAVHVLCLVGRYRRWNLALVALAWVAITAVLIGTIYQPDTTVLGVLPTRATWDGVWQAIADSWSQFRVTVAPVPPDGGFGISCAVGIAGIAFLSDTFAFRAYGRAEAVIPGGLLFVVASSLGYDRLRLTSTAVWLVAAFVCVALLRAAHSEPNTPWLGGGPSRRLAAVAGGGLGVAVVAALVAVTVGPRLPGADADALVDTRNRSGNGTEVVSPLVDIQARLVNRTNVEMFTVTTDQPAYLRLTSLESFNGSEWRQNRDYDDQDELVDPSTTDGIHQTITIANLGNIWLPAAFRPLAVSASVDIRYNADSGSIIRSRGDLFEGLDYTVVSSFPTATPEQLASSTSSAGPGSDYLQLPDDFPDSFRQLAVEITAGAESAYAQAIALQSWFRNNFRYDVNVPRGHSDRAMESFINQRAGYCEQFAGTFAALARSLGLAARVAVGFTPGDLDEAGLWHVLGKHAHAWPEVWFDEIGWVLFEPTPGRGAPGAESYTGVAAEQAGGILTGPPDEVATGNGGREPTATTVATAASTTPRNPDERDPTAAGGSAVPPTLPGSGGSGSGGLPAPLTIVLALLGAGLLWVLAMPTVVRAIRSGRMNSPSERIVASWREATIAIGLAGAARRPDETPREHAERAWRMTGCDKASVQRLAELVTAAAYGAREPNDEAAAEGERLTHDITTGLYRRSTFAERLRRRTDPRLI